MLPTKPVMCSLQELADLLQTFIHNVQDRMAIDSGEVELPSIEPDHIYSQQDVAGLLGISIKSVQRLVRTHQLPSKKIAGQVRIKGSDVLEMWDHLPYSDGDALEEEEGNEGED